MKFKIYHISKGIESKFDLFSPLWFYRSKFEDWLIIRIFGIYFWIYPRYHKINFLRNNLERVDSIGVRDDTKGGKD